MVDARRLGMLAALDRLGTVAAVAERLHLTAPGVSMQLGVLEREVGVPLTERRGRRLALTPAGRLLAAHGHRVVDQLELAELEVGAIRRGEVGTYRIAAFPSAARTFVAEAWDRMRREESAIELVLSTPEPTEALAGLVVGDVDLAVVHSYSNVPRDVPSDVELVELATEPVSVAIRGDDPAAGPTVRLEDLERHPWVAAPSGMACREMTERATGLAGYRPRVVAESVDFAVQLRLVAAGIGVALVPSLTVASLPDGVHLAEPDPPVQRRLFAAYRSERAADPALQALVRGLRGTAVEAVMPGRA